MALRLTDKWIWDLWLVIDGVDYHAFYLQAPRSLGDAEKRHWNVTIGHAVSQDLLKWELLPDALQPAQEPAWDDYTTWSGSVIRHEGRWYMFYTGGCRAEDATIQRIGFVVSDDLVQWERVQENPVILYDPRRYEGFDPAVWHDHTWRDPWIAWDPDSGSYCAFITARVRIGPTDGRGVVALARSENLCEWEILEPVTPAGGFGYLELPQAVNIEGTHYLIFSTVGPFHSIARLKMLRTPIETGIHYLAAEHLTGPYEYVTNTFLLGDEQGTHY